MGASSCDYINESAMHGGRFAIADETWAVNAMGATIAHDRLFAIDDLGELRMDAREHGKKVANGMLSWLPSHPGPVYTATPYTDIVPGSVCFPYEEVINACGFPYFNNSVACAVGYAIYLGVQNLKLYGCDFTYRERNIGEAGRGNVEWLLGLAGARGMNISVSDSTTLMDADLPLDQRLYGFREPVLVGQDETGVWRVTYPEREKEAAA